MVFLDRYKPTDMACAKAMLELAELKPGELHIDLGSGDGRFCYLASEMRARSIGYELDEELARKSQAKLGSKATIINADCLTADLSEADVVTFWFIQQCVQVFVKCKMEMKKGSRIVSGHAIPEYEADEIKKLWNGKIYLYRN